METSTISTEQINERSLKLASERNIDPNSLNTAERYALDAEAKAQLTYESHPAVQEAEALKQEVALLRGQNETLRAVKSQPVQSGTASFNAAQVRGRMGQDFYKLSNDQKLRAAGINPAEVSLSEVKKFFGRGANTTAALDYSRNAPGRYATLREVARLLDLDGR